jgi:hypothetical protein
MKIVLSSAICLLLIQSAFGQVRKEKFGKVSIQDLEMTVYPQDSSAEAVVLYSQGFFKANDIRFFRHLRVKILKKSGLDWGNWTFAIPSKSAIRGVVHNLVNGEVVKEKLKLSDVFEEEISKNYRVYKVFMPNVKVGSVIEIAYDFQGVPFEWRFQEKIPVRYSELKMERSQYIDFSYNTYGFEPIKTLSMGTHWMVSDMPAFTSEPYMNHYSNFITKFEFEVKSINIPGRYYDDFTTSWEAVNKELMDATYCGGVLKETMFLNNFAKSVGALDLSVEEKIDTAYKYIASNLAWNGSHNLYVTTYLRDRFRNEHKGNSAEINLSLVSLLKKMDIDANPVALSTRDHGILNPLVPSMRKLNYVIACAKVGEKNILMDATAKNLSPGYLPERAMNGAGRLLSNDGTYWVSLVSEGKDKIQSMVTIDIKPGNFQCTIQNRYKSYAYLDWKENYNNYDSPDAYKSKLEELYGGLSIQEYQPKMSPKKLSASETITADISNLIDDFGGEIIFQPLFFMDFKENPFSNPERKYPVDFITLKSRASIVNINVSDDYEIVSVPQSTLLKLPQNTAELRFLCNTKGQTVQIQATVSINKTTFTESEYLDLKTYYTMVIEKINDGIVLKKKA